MKKEHQTFQDSSIREVNNLAVNLSRFPNWRALRDSQWFGANKHRLDKVLNTVRVENPCAVQFEQPTLRVVSWNIEKGKRFREILHQFESDDRLAGADVIAMQEVDGGMARSENRFIAADLARSLHMNYAYAPALIELTKGIGDDLESNSENICGLQGNAVLSRAEILEAHSVGLPQCFEPFDHSEKRYGGRNALFCRFHWKDRDLMVVSTHLEVRNTPACRARQMKVLLDKLAGFGSSSAVLGGDFNTNTFARGSRWRTLKSFCRLAWTGENALLQSLLNPQDREPLFHALESRGFEWRSGNDDRPSSSTHLQSLEDIRWIPRSLLQRGRRVIERYKAGLPLRLDWLCVRDLQVVANEESPLTLETFSDGSPTERISDHRPIICTVEMK
ncbi:MAG: endonuclease/exonuclease/phosphatase family protein [Acidobacteriia bacterium]|nr:endonuclease/exonuclease/phosphatase family protein [Terriglobia bacterium]